MGKEWGNGRRGWFFEERACGDPVERQRKRGVQAFSVWAEVIGYCTRRDRGRGV